MKKPKVSIIIPYYKKKLFIRQTLNSVFNQSYKNYEIIIIYDDFDHKDLKYIKTIIPNNIKFKIVKNKKNIGAGLSRNLGISLSKGKYICFLDADDIWNKEKLKFQLSVMEKNNYNFTHTNYKIINQDGEIIGNRHAKKEINYKILLRSCDIGLSTVMIKKKILGKKEFPNLKTKEDYVLWLELSKVIKLNGINKNLVIWRKSKNSLSSNTFQKLKDGYLVYFKYMKFNFVKSIYYLFILSFNYLLKK